MHGSCGTQTAATQCGGWNAGTTNLFNQQRRMMELLGQKTTLH